MTLIILGTRAVMGVLIFLSIKYDMNSLSTTTHSFIVLRYWHILKQSVTTSPRNVSDADRHCIAFRQSFEKFGHQLSKTCEIGNMWPAVDCRKGTHPRTQIIPPNLRYSSKKTGHGVCQEAPTVFTFINHSEFWNRIFCLFGETRF